MDLLDNQDNEETIDSEDKEEKIDSTTYRIPGFSMIKIY